jgi:hypothetical protein
MNLILIGSLTASAALIILLILLVRKNSPGQASLPVTAAWIDELSVERYRPMMRLLDHRDVEFLRSQPGFTPGMLRRLRAQRALIFREYLRCLSEDFHRVCAALKLLMLQSRHDRPDLAAALLRQQTLFWGAMLQARFRLVLYRAGLGGVDVSELVQIFDGMRIELRSLVPATMGAPA